MKFDRDEMQKFKKHRKIGKEPRHPSAVKIYSVDELFAAEGSEIERGGEREMYYVL